MILISILTGCVPRVTITGGSQRAHPGYSQHFQRLVGLSNPVAHLRHYGSSNVRRQILQGMETTTVDS